MSDLTTDQRDWLVFARLARIVTAGHKLGREAQKAFNNLKASHPDWNPNVDEKTDFAVWSESSIGERGDPNVLKNVPTSKILTKVRELVEADRWANDGLWAKFISAEPRRGFEALKVAAVKGETGADEWRQLFYKLREDDDPPFQTAVIEFLLTCEIDAVWGAAHAIAMWFETRYLRLVEISDGAAKPLRLWDKLASRLVREGESFHDVKRDPTFAVLNEPSGQLAEVLIHELNRRKLPKSAGLPEDLAPRFDLAICWPGDAGLIAQCAFCMQLPFLDFIAEEWVRATIVPLLQPRCENALARWRSRFMAADVGSAGLFNGTHDGFFWTFDHVDSDHISDGQLLILLQAAYRKTEGEPFDLTPSEAKSALARAGARAMSSTARILRLGGDKLSPEDHWRTVVKPVLMFVWPTDANLQTSSTTAALIDLAMDANGAFPDAISTVRPFLVPAWAGDHSWHFETDFDERGVALLARHPTAGLMILDSLIPADTGPSRLNELLDLIEGADGELVKDSRFIRLRGLARRLAA